MSAMPTSSASPLLWYAITRGAKVLVKQLSEQQAQKHHAAGWELKAFATRQGARTEAMTWEGRLSDALG